MDAIEQGNRVFGLVGLQLADKVKLDIGMGRADGGPLVLRFLDAVLAEHALALRDQIEDRLGGLGLGDCDQRHLIGLAPGDARGGGDARTDLFERR